MIDHGDDSTSSGAVLTAWATSAGIGVTGLALSEPPLALDGTHQPEPSAGQDHKAAAQAIAPVLIEQLAGASAAPRHAA